MDEHDLEDALITHLQEFILELGKGFCFETRQKRIIIDDEYYYPDLVFYNRILHCGVIIELKNEEFSHENLGQLNAYVSHYRENEMRPGDNPPVGILFCTRKGKKMVEYALAGMDNHLFVLVIVVRCFYSFLYHVCIIFSNTALNHILRRVKNTCESQKKTLRITDLQYANYSTAICEEIICDSHAFSGL